jgi:methylated-DNA-[protein]-cysteine S-methyltransferase
VDLVLSRVPSPLGDLLLVTAGTAVVSLDFEDNLERLSTLLHRRMGDVEPEEGDAPEEVARRLKRYFKGHLHALDSQRLFLAGTQFQEQVWHALREVPVGETASYGELADSLGMSVGAARAVGAANGANPVSLFVPCHRIVGADGSLTGYAGGLDRKRWLLRHEGANVLGKFRQTSLF